MRRWIRTVSTSSPSVRDSSGKWLDAKGKEFSPRTHYNAGGSTKFYGGTALRFWESDFLAREVGEGRTFAWPFDYSNSPCDGFPCTYRAKGDAEN